MCRSQPSKIASLLSSQRILKSDSLLTPQATAVDMDILVNSDAPALSSDYQPALPYEVMHIVLKFYIEARTREVRTGRYSDLPDYPVISILTVSKWFHGTTVSLLYADVTFRRGTILEKFLSRPNISSYQHVKRLEIKDAYFKICYTIIKRTTQILIMWVAIEKDSPDALSSSLDNLDKTFAQWLKRRPKASVRITGDAAFALGSFLSYM